MPKILTVRAVEAARPSLRRRELPDGVVPGLYLVVQPSGSKSWALRYRLGGRSIKLTIGSAGVLELAAARAAARAALASIAAGNDPALVKRNARAQAPETFETVAGRFIERYAKLHNKSWRDSERILQREAVPHWRHRPIASITRVDVVALIDVIVDRGAPAMANRTLTVLRRLFGWCVERGTLELSPCERVKDPAPETRRERVHSDAELREIWRAADLLGYPFGSVVKLLLLTGARREEVAGMRWSELAADFSLWTLPPERVKNKKEHEIPLSAPARALLAELPRISEFVFTTTGAVPVSGFARAKRRLDQAITPPLPPWVLHDLRRSLASGMAALGVQLPVVEKILNHVGNSFSGVRGVYQRYDFSREKQRALELWGRHVLSLAQRRKSSNVIDLAGRG